jgi:HAD superfamily hydrolase (TIGR01509 family)
MPNQLELPAALIFDMDGVLIDSNSFHLEKWAGYLREHKIPFKEEELPLLILGKRNDSLIRHFFGPNVTQEESRRMSEEVEARFRAAFEAHARPLPGLDRLIRECHAAGIPMAVASSAMCKNVEFAVDALGYRPYFRRMVSGDEVAHAKPDPEIYLKAAARLEVRPQDCVAFEDSFPGIGAVLAAGMKCVAIASTFPIEELRTSGAHRVAASFEEISLDSLKALFQRN